jgi:hypothetical protein
MKTVIPNTTQCYAIVITRDKEVGDSYDTVSIVGWAVSYDNEEDEAITTPLVPGLCSNQEVWVVHPSGYVDDIWNQTYKSVEDFMAGELR